MRAAYIGGGPTDVPYVPNPPLFLPFFHVSSQPNLSLPLSSTFASTLSTSSLDRPRYSRPLPSPSLRLQAGWFIWFNDAFERERERMIGGYLAYERFILVSCFFRFPSIKDLNVGGDCHA